MNADLIEHTHTSHATRQTRTHVTPSWSNTPSRDAILATSAQNGSCTAPALATSRAQCLRIFAHSLRSANDYTSKLTLDDQPRCRYAAALLPRQLCAPPPSNSRNSPRSLSAPSRSLQRRRSRTAPFPSGSASGPATPSGTAPAAATLAAAATAPPAPPTTPPRAFPHRNNTN
jgi:hypothetical protein